MKMPLTYNLQELEPSMRKSYKQLTSFIIQINVSIGCEQVVPGIFPV